MTERPKFSNLIRELRKRLGLSQEQLARQLGVSFQTVNRWENGRAIPSPMGMKLIEQLLMKMPTQDQELWEQYLSEQEPNR
ncbi:helix-turn-helix domain-containing protein [Pelatocladus sp. BLCC-F211]|uniref:helix-turn-helix domain-containing protein n=1 Tax=Pelatocladus sp. BLCC-F211 TaxID=3342752 RepID=UPI0035BA256B|nr:helix-turn-helix transcriptional regulator [Fischerella sp. CENA71]